MVKDQDIALSLPVWTRPNEVKLDGSSQTFCEVPLVHPYACRIDHQKDCRLQRDCPRSEPSVHKDAPGAFDLVADCDSSFIKGWVNT